MTLLRTFSFLSILIAAGCKNDQSERVEKNDRPIVDIADEDLAGNGSGNDKNDSSDDLQTGSNNHLTYEFNDSSQNRPGNHGSSSYEVEGNNNNTSNFNKEPKKNGPVQKIWPEKNWGNFLDSLKPKLQIFDIDPLHDTVLICEKGTKVFLPAEALSYKDQSGPAGRVKVAIKECTKFSEFIGEKLTTRSGSKLLETGGMIHIDFRDKSNRELVIRDSARYAIVFPVKQRLNGMKLFYGEVDSTGSKTWSEDTLFQNTTIVKRQFGVDLDARFMPINQTDLFYYKECVLDFREDNSTYSSADLSDSESGKKPALYARFEEWFGERTKMRQDFCDCKLKAELRVTFDEMGNVYGIKFEQNSRPEYDSLFYEFFATIPQKQDASPLVNAPSDTRKMTFSFRDMEDKTKFEYQFNKKYEEFRNKTMEISDSRELDNYILVANNSGWINCDRFSAMRGKRIKFMVNAGSTAGITVWIIFKRVRAALLAEHDEQSFYYRGLPSNEEVKIVAVNYENLQPQIAAADVIVSTTTVQLGTFKTFTLDELEKMVDVD
jgi:hypothetical protein